MDARYQAVLAVLGSLFFTPLHAQRVEWEAALPMRAFGMGETGFSQAMELANGDFLVAPPMGSSNPVLARLDSQGRLRWKTTILNTDGPPWPGGVYGLAETPRGIAAVTFRTFGYKGRFWGEAGIAATLFDDTGGVADFDPIGSINDIVRPAADGGFLGLKNDYSNESGVPGTFVLGKYGWGSGPNWVTTLGPLSLAYSNFSALLDQGAGRLLALSVYQTPSAGDSLLVWSVSAAGKVEWDAKLAIAAGNSAMDSAATWEIWQAAAPKPAGGFILAGITTDAADIPAGLVLFSVDGRGKAEWLRRYRIPDGSGNFTTTGWSIDGLDAQGSGTVTLRMVRSTRWDSEWRLLELGPDWATPRTVVSAPRQHLPSAWTALGAPGEGKGIRWGESEDTLASARITNENKPWALGYPTLFLPGASGGEEWKRLRLEAYRDTIFWRTFNSERAFDTAYTGPPKISFFLATRDGGH